jgi:hypothetical protein
MPAAQVLGSRRALEVIQALVLVERINVRRGANVHIPSPTAVPPGWGDVVDLGNLGSLTLAGRGRFWRLRYRACGHTQEFPRDAAVHTQEQAKREIQRHYTSV